MQERTTQNNLDIELRPEVEHFAKAMEANLREYDIQAEWKDSEIDYLFSRFLETIAELYGAIATHRIKRIKAGCTDVANLAMLISDSID